MRVLLVCMPWLGLHLPSLALSTLAPLGRQSQCVDSLDVRYANIEWAQFVHDASAGELDGGTYTRISESAFAATGEWIFSGSLYDEPDPGSTRYDSTLAASGHDMAAARRMYRLAIEFVDRLAGDICGQGYDVVGFTSTFVQNIPSFALARAIKARTPETVIVFGGANCDTEQGAAIHRNFPFIDYVVRGEAEIAFPCLLGLIAGEPGTDPKAIPGLCWRDDGVSVANRMPDGGVDMAAVPGPAYDEYFAAFAGAPVCAGIRPWIVLEGARGCWWGAKHHCTFCGLNDTLMDFRAKEPGRVLEELKAAVAKHQVLDVMFADNILSQGFVRELLPRIRELGWDLQIFFEIKANQSYSQLEGIARAGVARVQPGIESFSTPVLKLMRKGVTGWQNVRFLRDCATLGIDPAWNLLYGFPGESDEDYEPMIAQLPHLIHLKPPHGAGRVALTRFAPFFDDPSLGMRNLGPARSYQEIYRLPAEELADLVYLFQSQEAGVRSEMVEVLKTHVAAWLGRGTGRDLAALADGDGLVIVDERQRAGAVEYTLPPEAAAVYRALLKGRTVATLSAVTPGQPVGEFLAEWTDSGLVYRDGDHYVALATGLAY
jgi:ribosomal peptide maturation radical SAM protein 1